MTIYPSVLDADLSEIARQISLCRDSGDVETIQLDIIDGYFVDNITPFPGDFAGIDFGDLRIDFHLMTQEPLDFVHEIIEFKDELPVRAVIGQIEQMGSQGNFLEEVKRYGWKAGLSLNLFTPLDEIEEESWELMDVIQVMGIEAGFQGQKFNTSVLEFMTEIQAEIEDRDKVIELLVDGGVKLNNIREIADHGAESVTVGSALWKAADFDTTYQEFMNVE